MSQNLSDAMDQALNTLGNLVGNLDTLRVEARSLIVKIEAAQLDIAVNEEEPDYQLPTTHQHNLQAADFASGIDDVQAAFNAAESALEDLRIAATETLRRSQ